MLGTIHDRVKCFDFGLVELIDAYQDCHQNKKRPHTLRRGNALLIVSNSTKLTNLRMDFLRYRSNAWGQQVLDGVSWELLWAFIVAGFAVVAVHAAYARWRSKLRKRNAVDE